MNAPDVDTGRSYFFIAHSFAVKIQFVVLAVCGLLDADFANLRFKMLQEKFNGDSAIFKPIKSDAYPRGLVGVRVQNVCDMPEIALLGCGRTLFEKQERSRDCMILDESLYGEVITSWECDFVLLSGGRCGHTYLLSYRGQTGVVVA